MATHPLEGVPGGGLRPVVVGAADGIERLVACRIAQPDASILPLA